jgi:hypothetical protein
MEMELIGLDEISGKKERQQRREERKEKREEKKEDRKEKKEEKKKEKEKKKDERKDKRDKKKDERKDKRDNKKKDRQEKKKARGGSRAKKFFLAPARAAFFLLMKVNFLQLRKKLREGWKKDKRKIEEGVIKKFGFKRENFLKELNRKESESLSAGFGSDPATATAVAQATPILVTVTKLLTALGVTAGALANAKNSLTGKDKELADEFTEGVEADSNLPADEKESGGGQSPDDFKEKPDLNQGSGGGGLMAGKMPLYLGIGAAAIAAVYFLTKKK